MTTDTVALEQEVHELLSRLGVPERRYSQGELIVRTPITGQIIARVATTTEAAAREAIAAAHEAFLEWRNVPAPRRGELVRVLGEELRAEIETLGRLVTIETGKLLSEGFGEVQEMDSLPPLAESWRELLNILSEAVRDLDADKLSEESFNSFRAILQIGLEVTKERRAVVTSNNSLQAVITASEGYEEVTPRGVAGRSLVESESG